MVSSILIQSYLLYELQITICMSVMPWSESYLINLIVAIDLMYEESFYASDSVIATYSET